MQPLLIDYPEFDPVAIALGPISIRWYALAYITGIVLGWQLMKVIARRPPRLMSDEQVDDFVVWATLGIVLGGRIGYVLFYNLPQFAAHPIEILEVWKGGMSFHGGFVGCVLAVILFGYLRGISILSLGDVTCAVGPIGLFLGRLANFVNGELWGRPTDVPWAMIFPNGGPFPRHPSQLYEATLEGLVLLILLAIAIRMGALKRPGLIIGLFAMFYAVMRTFCEFFREPDIQIGFLWNTGLTMGMLLSIPLFLAGVGFAAVALRNPKLA